MIRLSNRGIGQCRKGAEWALLCFLVILVPAANAGDAEALLSLKSSVDPENLLPWEQASADMVCSWFGVRMCSGGRVTKLVLEFQNLSGSLDGSSLNQLNELRVLSFKGNSLTGPIPDVSNLSNLKSLFLNENDFSGKFPDSLSTLHRLKVVSLSNNRLTGPIPDSIVGLPRLYTLYLQNNRFEGTIPPLNQSTLTFLNVSNNNLSGPIPVTSSLSRFNASSFSGNLKLCGSQLPTPCASPPAPSPSETDSPAPHRRGTKKKMIAIVAGIAGGLLLLLLLAGLGIMIAQSRRRRKIGGRAEKSPEKAEEGASGREATAERDLGGGGFSWDREGLGALVFLGDGEAHLGYTLEDLLKASAETLGRGTVGSTYKAVLESGFIVTVKRLKDASYPRLEEFQEHMAALGKFRHPNLVPLRAYFQAKEERLLVYDYFPNGSLYSLLHGARASTNGKPLHWTSCLKIAEDVATGLLYIHQTAGFAHGNLKSSNILLGQEFESCITDYGLTALLDPETADEPSGSSLVYTAPEIRGRSRKLAKQQSDVYSFGVILLELLTGKTPFQDLVQEHGLDIPKWVRSAREGETDSGDDRSSGNEGDDKLQALVGIAMTCVSQAADTRPPIKDVLRMIKEARGETMVSSNSSDHSPGRWSDTIVSVPREHLSM